MRLPSSIGAFTKKVNHLIVRCIFVMRNHQTKLRELVRVIPTLCVPTMRLWWKGRRVTLIPTFDTHARGATLGKALAVSAFVSTGPYRVTFSNCTWHCNMTLEHI